MAPVPDAPTRSQRCIPAKRCAANVFHHKPHRRRTHRGAGGAKGSRQTCARKPNISRNTNETKGIYCSHTRVSRRRNAGSNLVRRARTSCARFGRSRATQRGCYTNSRHVNNYRQEAENNMIEPEDRFFLVVCGPCLGRVRAYDLVVGSVGTEARNNSKSAICRMRGRFFLRHRPLTYCARSKGARRSPESAERVPYINTNTFGQASNKR